VRGEGTDVDLPLACSSAELQLDVYMSSLTGNERVPLRANLNWDSATEILHAELFTRGLPMSLLGRVMPELFPSGGELLGEIDGSLRLEHHARAPAGKRWRFASSS